MCNKISNDSRFSLRRTVTHTLLGGVFFTLSSFATAASIKTDPTRPLGMVEIAKSAKKLSLSSILLSPERQVAVINGRIVKENSRISGATVLSIREKSVVVRRNGVTETLRLSHRSVKTAVKK